MGATTTNYLIMFAIPYLVIEYLVIWAFSGTVKTTQATGYAVILPFLSTIFGGIGGYLNGQIPAFIAGPLVLVHVIMLGILGVWIYQSLNPI